MPYAIQLPYDDEGFAQSGLRQSNVNSVSVFELFIHSGTLPSFEMLAWYSHLEQQCDRIAVDHPNSQNLS